MRILVVLREPLDASRIRDRCYLPLAEGHEVAVCYVSDAASTLQGTLTVQRQLTTLLRQTLDGSAEAIPVFVVPEQGPDQIGECARAWGAAEIRG